MTVYNTASTGTGATAVTSGEYYNDGTQWVRLLNSTPDIQSVSLSTDISIDKNTPGSQPPAYANISGMTLIFTAKKTSVLVMLSGSGYGYTNSMSYVIFRVLNGATSIGGTMNKIQNYDDGTVTTWSLSFSKLLTGLTIGTNYTLIVQGFADGITGIEDVTIDASSIPDQCHLTLTVLH